MRVRLECHDCPAGGVESEQTARELAEGHQRAHGQDVNVEEVETT